MSTVRYLAGLVSLWTALAARSAMAQPQVAPPADDEDPFEEEGALIPNAQPPAKPLPLVPPPRLRVQIKAGLAETYGPSWIQWSDGNREYESCPSFPCGLRFALGAGVDWSPVRYFGIGLHARWLVGRATWEEALGRHLDIVEVLVAPQLNLPWKWHWPPGGMRPYLALPFGPAWSFQSRTWSRAVHEDWNSRIGLSAGVALGMEFYWKHRLGWFFELNYQQHYLSADVIQTPVDEPAARATERVTAREAALILSIGHLFSLDR
jgi:hypothetical protein